MTGRRLIGWCAAALLLLPASCREAAGPAVSYAPIVEARLVQRGAFEATVSVHSFDVERLWYAARAEACSADELLTSGLSRPTDGLVNAASLLNLEGLQGETDYLLSVAGEAPDGSLSAVVTVPFRTGRGPERRYEWELRRSGPPAFADVSLVTRGQHNSSAPLWTVERFAPHVSFTDETGAEHWLFEAILCTEGFDSARGMTLSIAPNGWPSGTREAWEDLIDYWLAPEGTLSILDEAVARAARRMGPPPSPRKIIIGVPDPILLERFSDKTSATDYWGTLDGVRLDFADVDDQVKAYLWFMDTCRSKFDRLSPRYLELAGFYIISEELPLAPSFYTAAGMTASTAESWNHAYKRWETILPETAAYLHACQEGLYWVPYYLAPGHRVWKELGIDMAWMQPNHYWDTQNQHPMRYSLAAMRTYGMGIELEFEYSLVREVMADGRWGPDGAGRATFQFKDIPALADRLREYMDGFRDTGLYGVSPIALYSGTDALHQLAVSADPEDQAMYLEICHFIADNPLR